MPTTIALDDLPSLVGTQLGPTSWRDVPQSTVDGFAALTGDDQWIHVEPERAAAGPFGGTIAHGFLTLALAPVLVAELLQVEGVGLTVNYGLDRVRFPAPVPVGTAITGRLTVTGLREVPGAVQAAMTLVIERDGGLKPVCVADLLVRYYR